MQIIRYCSSFLKNVPWFSFFYDSFQLFFNMNEKNLFRCNCGRSRAHYFLFITDVMLMVCICHRSFYLFSLKIKVTYTYIILSLYVSSSGFLENTKHTCPKIYQYDDYIKWKNTQVHAVTVLSVWCVVSHGIKFNEDFKTVNKTYVKCNMFKRGNNLFSYYRKNRELYIYI